MTSKSRERRRSRLGAVLRFPLTRIVIAVAMIMGAALALQIALSWLHQVTGFEFLPPGRRFLPLVLLAIVSHFAYVGYVRLVERRAVGELAGPAALPEVGRGVLVGGGLLLGSLGLIAALGYCRIDGVNPWTGMFLAFAAALQASYFEEVLFRGVLFRIVEESLGTWLALAISAGIFGFAHFQNPDATLVGLVAITVEAGILLGAAYVLTRRLWLAIGIHFGWNFSQLTFGLGPVDAGTVFQSRLDGPVAIVGDASGMDSSIIAVTLCVAAAVVLLVAAHRKGHFVRPFWARTTEETNNETMGEETSP